MAKFTAPTRLATEAAVIAAAFAVLFYVVHMLAARMTSRARSLEQGALAVQVAAAAAMFHVACEYSGLNAWYCRERR